MDALTHIVKLIQGGAGNLAAYLAAHVLLCLVPAFFIAGAMTALIPKETITGFLGRNTPRVLSYPAAAIAGSVLAVCSCTIVPLFAGIYKKGAGIGPAITFLFFAPAANILALVYTGHILGADLALARLVLSLAFGIGIGMIMALIFHHDDAAHDEETDLLFMDQGKLRKGVLIFLSALVLLLLSGTLKLDVLTAAYGQITIPIRGMDAFQSWLYQLIPFDASKGEEGVSTQGAILIALLSLIGITAWKGLRDVIEGFNAWTWPALIMIILTLLTAAVGMVPRTEGLTLLFTGKFFGVALNLAALSYLGRRFLQSNEINEWLWESWRFVQQIFPLLVVGVFAVGILRQLIQPEWIRFLAGANTVVGNLSGVVFGVFMYFPTLVEVPIANMFLDLGMHRGPLLAYLMADPELSLQSILITSAIIGRIKTWTYVAWVALFSTLAGLIYGAWIDGASIWLLGLYLSGFLGILAAVLYFVNRWNDRAMLTNNAGK